MNCGALDTICPPSATAKDMFFRQPPEFRLVGLLDVGAIVGLASARKTGPEGGLGSGLVIGGALVCVEMCSGLPNLPGTDGMLAKGNLNTSPHRCTTTVTTEASESKGKKRNPPPESPAALKVIGLLANCF